MIRRLLVPLLVSALAVTATVATSVPAAATTPLPAPAAANRTYVALGDSYAAGYALAAPAQPTGQPVPSCGQTTRDYPHQVATALNLQLIDVTCNGATVADLFHPQSTGTDPSPAAQLDAVRTAHPALVTLTIGLNDLEFLWGVVSDCLALAPTGQLFLHPTYRTCEDYYASSAFDGGKPHNPYDKLPSVVAKVRTAITAVRTAAPRAQVVVVTYPALAPDAANTPTDGCYRALIPQNGSLLPSALPIVDTDVAYVQTLQRQFDTRLATAARALGATVVDLYQSSLAHSACSPPDTRWVEPVVAADRRTINGRQPSLLGTRAMAIGVVRAYVQGP